jgi:AraC family transcriptional regulator of adaptative response / DNA-3-methyladenine glycosylase II
LAYRPPYDWKSLLGFLAYRAIPGVELVSDDSYARSISLEGMSGYFIARFLPEKNQLAATIQFPDTKYLYQIIDRIRSIFDLRADSAQIDKFLKKDKMLRPLLRKYPGLRVPGSWDGFEVSVRAVLGQQVTVKAASTLASRIAQRYGSEFDCEIDGINRVFPEPAVLARAKMNNMGIVSQRIAAIKSIAELIEGNELIINCTADTAEFVGKICQVKGIGEWTAQYIAMRALSDPNAFPYSDLILLRAADPSGKSLTPKQLLKLAEAWRPWRAYTVILLWKHYQMTLIPNSKARAVDRNKK